MVECALSANVRKSTIDTGVPEKRTLSGLCRRLNHKLFGEGQPKDSIRQVAAGKLDQRGVRSPLHQYTSI